VVHGTRYLVPGTEYAAEGCGKSSRAETIRYLEIAAGSAAETEHHLLVARDTGILTTRQAERFLSTTGSVRRMLRSLIQRLPPDPARPSKPPQVIGGT